MRTREGLKLVFISAVIAGGVLEMLTLAVADVPVVRIDAATDECVSVDAPPGTRASCDALPEKYTRVYVAPIREN